MAKVSLPQNPTGPIPDSLLEEAANLIRNSNFTTAFTGAGISVESGIPPFRGEDGLWAKYDPHILEIGYFTRNALHSWHCIKEIFYRYMEKAQPNDAHLVLARLEQHGLLGRTITQNIDNLHQEAGCKQVYEFHGNAKELICLSCPRNYRIGEVSLDHLPPTCRECGGLLKPDFVFFGEPIPQIAFAAAHEAAAISDVLLVIGTTGEVMPANQVPVAAKRYGAKIVEINPSPSLYTEQITDIFLQGTASGVLKMLEKKLFPPSL